VIGTACPWGWLGGLNNIEKKYELHAQMVRGVFPVFVAGSIINMVAGYFHSVWLAGPAITALDPTACTTVRKALAWPRRNIAYGERM